MFNNEAYSYDANGNRTYRTLGNPYLIYTYDDENQLIRVATDTSYTMESLRWRTDFSYDGKGRLRVRKEYYWVSGMGWSLTGERPLPVPVPGVPNHRCFPFPAPLLGLRRRSLNSQFSDADVRKRVKHGAEISLSY